MADLKDRLKKALEERGIRPSDLSRKTGISEAALSHYLKGDYNPGPKKVKLIADALSVPEAWILGYGDGNIPDSEGDDLEIIYHRDGRRIKKRFTEEQMKRLLEIIEGEAENKKD